jgi:hypothetical protein
MFQIKSGFTQKNVDICSDVYPGLYAHASISRRMLMNANPYCYPQDGQFQKRSRKRPLRRFITVISIILVISVLSMTLANFFV